MKCFVTGGAGFIGSNLVERLLLRGDEVVVFDNFSTGLREFLSAVEGGPGCTVVEGDLLDKDLLQSVMQGCEMVFHLAANADVRRGTDHPGKDLEQNTIGTHNVLEAMRASGIRDIVFSSTGSVYGEPDIFPTPENAPFPRQTSLYGASKLSAEALLQAYCEGFEFRSWIFRFVSVLGERYSHGHVIDFYRQLLDGPGKLSILGNGKQRKSYMHVQDCIDAIFVATSKSKDRVNIFNLGTPEHCTVDESAGWIAEYMGASPEIEHSGGKRGWIGDSPFIYLDTSKIQKLGWKPKLGIRQAVEKTVQYLKENGWILDQRK